MQCGPMFWYQRFGGVFCFHVQDILKKNKNLWHKLHFCLNYVTEKVSEVKRNSKERSEEARKVEKTCQEVKNVGYKT
jgi:uncharacterized alpha-E superfamily protein